MEKKNLKMYEAPVVEAMAMEMQGFLCSSTNDDHTTIEPPIGDDF